MMIHHLDISWEQLDEDMFDLSMWHFVIISTSQWLARSSESAIFFWTSDSHLNQRQFLNFQKPAEIMQGKSLQVYLNGRLCSFILLLYLPKDNESVCSWCSSHWQGRSGGCLASKGAKSTMCNASWVSPSKQVRQLPLKCLQVPGIKLVVHSSFWQLWIAKQLSQAQWRKFKALDEDSIVILFDSLQFAPHLVQVRGQTFTFYRRAKPKSNHTLPQSKFLYKC